MVEVDIETRSVRIVRYLVVEDCGQMINPAVVDGQMLGGVLFERAAYAADGRSSATR